MRKIVSSHILIPLVRQAQSLPSSVDGLPIKLTITDTRLDAIVDAARERYRAVEQAILDIEPDTLADMDLVFVLRPTRHIIGDDAFTPEQERRAHGMLDLVDVALVCRWAAAGPDNVGRLTLTASAKAEPRPHRRGLELNKHSAVAR